MSKETEVSHESDSDHEIEGKLTKFKCDLCTETFFSEFNLMTHVELKHEEDSFVPEKQEEGQELQKLVDDSCFPEPIAGPSRVDLPPKKSSKKHLGPQQAASRKQPALRAKKSK